MLKIERLALQGYVDLQNTADFGSTLEYKGKVPKRLGWLYDRHDRRYVSVFGEITISRTNLRYTPNTKTSARPVVWHCLFRQGGKDKNSRSKKYRGYQ